MFLARSIQQYMSRVGLRLFFGPRCGRYLFCLFEVRVMMCFASSGGPILCHTAKARQSRRCKTGKMGQREDVRLSEG